MQRAYYRFLASVATSTDCRHVIVTGGNHDSPSLLNAPDTLLEALNITVIGQATADPADEVVLLRDAAGTPLAVVAAVPYLRERDLRTSTENETQQDKEEKIRSATAEHYRRVTQTRSNCAVKTTSLTLPPGTSLPPTATRATKSATSISVLSA